MNSELIVKDVEFHGDMLRAAQDPDGKVWVGVRWMCQGIGFGEDKIDNERKKIQKVLQPSITELLICTRF